MVMFSYASPFVSKTPFPNLLPSSVPPYRPEIAAKALNLMLEGYERSRYRSHNWLASKGSASTNLPG
jgi:hypothetical protein